MYFNFVSFSSNASFYFYFYFILFYAHIYGKVFHSNAIAGPQCSHEKLHELTELGDVILAAYVRCAVLSVFFTLISQLHHAVYEVSADNSMFLPEDRNTLHY
jgi:hypothetical protein